MSDYTKRFIADFKWAVPNAFVGAVGACRFEQGDVLYDTIKAYGELWSDCEPHINYSIQVKSPVRNSTGGNSGVSEEVFKANWISKVIFDLFDHKINKTRRIETTQGKLYNLLLNGDIDNLLNDDSLPPNTALSITDTFEFIAEDIENMLFWGAKKGCFLAMPYDITCPLLIQKHYNLINHLENLIASHIFIPFNNVSKKIEKSYTPTSQLSCFIFKDFDNFDEVLEIIKKSLYKPTKDKKSEREAFNVSKHGLLVVN